jgi:hypothetical protein
MASDDPAPQASIDPPSVEAAKLLGAVLAECRNDRALSRYAEVDLRAIAKSPRPGQRACRAAASAISAAFSTFSTIAAEPRRSYA